MVSLLTIFGITDASAATTTAGTPAGLTSFLPMIAIFFLVAYFLMIRPQNKRMKAHRKLLSELSKGDEVVTAGGVIGRIAKVNDDFITMAIAENVEINVQKSAISTVLPKGTMKNIT